MRDNRDMPLFAHHPRLKRDGLVRLRRDYNMTLAEVFALFWSRKVPVRTIASLAFQHSDHQRVTNELRRKFS